MNAEAVARKRYGKTVIARRRGCRPGPRARAATEPQKGAVQAKPPRLTAEAGRAQKVHRPRAEAANIDGAQEPRIRARKKSPNSHVQQPPSPENPRFLRKSGGFHAGRVKVTAARKRACFRNRPGPFRSRCGARRRSIPCGPGPGPPHRAARLRAAARRA